MTTTPKKVLIKKTPNDLSKPFTGIYTDMTDQQYFSEEISSWCVSQSTFKKIFSQSIQSILTEEKNRKISKAFGIGSALHYLNLENVKVFLENCFVKEDVYPVMTQKDYVAEHYEAVEFEVIPSKADFVAEKDLREPAPFPKQSEFEGTKEEWRLAKTEHDKLKEQFKKAKKEIEDSHKVLKAKNDELKKADKAAKDKAVSEWKKLKEENDFEKSEAERLLNEAEEAGKIILSEDDKEIIDMVSTVFYNHPKIMDIKNKSKAEVVVITYFEEFDIYVKIKMDLYDFESGILTDYKTTNEIGNNEFIKSYKKFEYDFQLALYREVARREGLEVNQVKIIASSKKVEEAAIYNISESLVSSGDYKFKKALEEYSKELKEFTNGKTRYDDELDLVDPWNQEEDLDSIFGDSSAS
ncbi:MAG: PD-(D/E)XK nuclease-like domain-containing protein [Bacteriovoracaceae bacterium]